MSDIKLEDLTWVELEKAFENTRKLSAAMLESLLAENSPAWTKALGMLREEWQKGRLLESVTHACGATDDGDEDPVYNMSITMGASIMNSFLYSLGMALEIGDMPDSMREALGEELASSLMKTAAIAAREQMFS